MQYNIRQKMQTCVFDKQTYFYLNPLQYEGKGELVDSECVVRCKYCKGESVLLQGKIIKDRYVCSICECHNDLPPNYKTTNVQQSVYRVQEKSMKDDKVRFLIVLDTNVNKQIREGLQAIINIWKDHKQCQISLVVYNQGIRVIELMQDGRVIQITQGTSSIITQHFYTINQQTLSVLQEYLMHDWESKGTTHNGSLLISQIVPQLKSKTIILWIGNLGQQIPYHQHKVLPHVITYCMVTVPTSVSGMQFSANLRRLTMNNNKALYITKNSKDMVQKTHYQLYEWFQNNTVFDYEIGCRSSSKYPPTLLTDYHHTLHNLHAGLIMKTLNKQKEKHSQKYQITLKYRKNKTVFKTIINFNYQQALSKKCKQQILKYIRLYVIMKKIPTRKEVYDFPAKHSIDIDVYNFLKECALLHQYQLYQCLYNPLSIYAVWPLIYKPNHYPTLVFYYIGCHIQEKYAQQLQQTYKQLLQLCHIFYCHREKVLPMYYQNIAQEVACQGQGSESSGSDGDGDRRYYMINK